MAKQIIVNSESKSIDVTIQARSNINLTVSRAVSITGVQSIVGGDNIGVSSSTGNVTISVIGTVPNAFYSTSSGSALTVSANAQPNITSLGTISSLTSSGNVTAPLFIGNFLGNIVGNLVVPGTTGDVLFNEGGNAAASSQLKFLSGTSTLDVGGNVIATRFEGSGSSLTDINAANISGTVQSANIANRANIANTVAGANVTGTVANATFATNAGSATIANIANVAYSVSGSNVVGQVANALIATTVTASAQPNITSLGTLTSLSVSGNILPTANVAYDLGSATNRFRDLYLSGTTLVLGDTSISATNGNISLGNFVVDSTSGTIAGTDIVGDVAGANHANIADLANSVAGSNVAGDVAGANHANISDVANSVAGSNVSGTVANATYAIQSGSLSSDISNVIITGGTSGQSITTDGAGNLMFTTVGGGGATPGGSNTQVQFNDSGALGASAGLTFVNTSNTLTVGSRVNVTETVIPNPNDPDNIFTYGEIKLTETFVNTTQDPPVTSVGSVTIRTNPYQFANGDNVFILPYTDAPGVLVNQGYGEGTYWSEQLVNFNFGGNSNFSLAKINNSPFSPSPNGDFSYSEIKIGAALIGAEAYNERFVSLVINPEMTSLDGNDLPVYSDYTLTLPITSGNVGEFLSTDGIGVLSWKIPGEVLPTTLTLSNIGPGGRGWEGELFVGTITLGFNSVEDYDSFVADAPSTFVIDDHLNSFEKFQLNEVTVIATAPGTMQVSINFSGFDNLGASTGSGPNNTIEYTTGEVGLTGVTTSTTTSLGVNQGTAATAPSSVVIGASAGASATGGSYVLIGQSAGAGIGGDGGIIAIGHGAASGTGGFIGSYNTMIGLNAGTAVTGMFNFSLGTDAGQTISGSHNLAIGKETFAGGITGDNNIGMGERAGAVGVNSNNIILGSQSGNVNAIVDNVILIGVGVEAPVGITSNVTIIGSSTVIDTYIGAGNLTVPANVTASRLISNIASGTAPFTVTSTTRVANLNVATAGEADSATVAASANSVAGANVSGEVANAAYATTSGLATFATTANAVAVGNVVGIGNIATTNYNGNGSQVLSGNGLWIAQGGGGGTPGGSNTQLQFNNNGSFGGISTVTYDGISLNLGSVGNINITGGTNGYVLSTNGSGNLSWVAQSGGGGGAESFAPFLLAGM